MEDGTDGRQGEQRIDSKEASLDKTGMEASRANTKRSDAKRAGLPLSCLKLHVHVLQSLEACGRGGGGVLLVLPSCLRDKLKPQRRAGHVEAA